MASRPCAACGRQVVAARVGDVERVFDAAVVDGGEWGVWHRQEGLHTVARARLHTPENHFGATGYQLHACPGAANTQLEIGAA